MEAPSTVRPAHVPPELVFDFDVYHLPGADRDFHLALKALQTQGCPDIFWTPHNGGHWVAARADDIYKIFADFEHFSNSNLTVPRGIKPPIPMYPIFADPPAHTAYRALINTSFSPKAIAAMETKVRELASRLALTLKARGGCDFVPDFAQHLPIEIFMSIVDVPVSDREQLLEWADGMVRPKQPTDVLQTIQKIFGYAAQKIAERRAKPGDDLITKLTQSKVFDRALTDDEVVGMVALILIGGMDTVVSALSFTANFLARSPQHRRQLIERPELIPKAVDELLRRFPVVNQSRSIDADYRYKDIQFKAGDMIMMPTTLHNLDERLFPNPLEVDFERPLPIHATFGNGPHRCPGSNLARTEMKVFLQEWLKVIPDFRIAAGQSPGMHSGVNATMHSLPLEWDA